jgi:iron complex transport system ATP-binding protein
MSMPQNILQTRNLALSYGTRPALRGVDLSLHPGELVALLGPNGSGKSTLIQSLFGYLHATGDIAWFGKPLEQWAPRDLARKVAYLPQMPQHQPGQPVHEVLQLGRSPYWAGFGIESPRDADVVLKIAAQLQLTDLLQRPMDELSGGQRQRVFIGRCLAQEPAALLLDEPNTYLDLKHQVELCQLLKRLSQTQSIAVLMASHDLNLAATYADRVIVLSNGKIAATGNIDVLEPQMLSAVYGVKLTRIDRVTRSPLFIAEPPEESDSLMHTNEHE